MNIVTCQRVARQRLGKQSVARLHNNGNYHVTVFCVVCAVTAAMQRLGKQTSTIETVFYAVRAEGLS
jgi:hypothetical protein